MALHGFTMFYLGKSLGFSSVVSRLGYAPRLRDHMRALAEQRQADAAKQQRLDALKKLRRGALGRGE